MAGREVLTRLAPIVDDVGSPLDFTWNLGRLRNWRRKVTMLKWARYVEAAGGDASAYDCRLGLVVIGDSGSARPVGVPVFTRLRGLDLGLAEVGTIALGGSGALVAAPAAVSLGIADAARDRLSRGVWVEWSKGWTFQNQTCPASVNTGCAIGGGDASFTIRCDTAMPPADVVRLLGVPLGEGTSLKYRWGGSGPWITLRLPDGPLQARKAVTAVAPWVLDLEGVPPAPTPLTVQVAAGTVCVTTASYLSTTRRGLSVHKIATGGGQMIRWAGAMATPQWRAAARAALSVADDPLDGDRRSAPDTIVAALSSNDANDEVPIAPFEAACRSFAASVRALWPYSDLLFVSGIDTEMRPIGAYTRAMRKISDEVDAAWVNMQPAFGVRASEYRRFQSDPVHPNDTDGRCILGGAMLHALSA